MDILTRFNNGNCDWQILSPGLAEDSGLETAVIISLFSDRRAEEGDVPAGSDHRGWWGDTYADSDGDRIGSRLWLLSREKQLPQALIKAEEYAMESLAWLVEDGIAGRVEVTAASIAAGILGLEIRIHRGDAPPSRYRFEYFWQGGLNAV